MKVVYIAGRFRGPTAWDVAQNVRLAEAAGLEVAKLGAMPLIPHANTALFNGQLTEEFWVKGTAQLLRRCDGLFVFDPLDVDRSAGTKAEVDLAEELHMPAFFGHEALGDLGRWARGEIAIFRGLEGRQHRSGDPPP